jgi:hypothetical protein
MKENKVSIDFSVLATELSTALQTSRKFRFNLQNTNKVTKEIVAEIRALIEQDVQKLIIALEKQIGNEMNDLPNLQNSTNLSGRLNDLKIYDKEIWSREGLVFGIWLTPPISKRFDAGFCVDSFEDGKAVIYCGFRLGPIEGNVKYFSEYYKLVDIYSAERKNIIVEAVEHFNAYLGDSIKSFLEYIKEEEQEKKN